MYMTTQYQTVRRSVDGGASNTSITNGVLGTNDVYFINPIEIDGTDPHILYQASSSLWRHPAAHIGGGGAWTQATKSLGSRITAIGTAKNIDYLTYVSSGGSVYRIENSNITTSTYDPLKLNTPGSGYLNCIAVDPNDGNHLVITYAAFGSGGQVYECTNAQFGDSATLEIDSGRSSRNSS